MSLQITLAPPVSPLRCTVLTDFAALEGRRADWLDLLDRSAANEPMLAPHWLLHWWRVYGATGGRTLRVGLFFDDDRLVGLAPLQGRRYWHRPGIPFRRLEPLGSDVDEGDGVGSDYLGVIAERGAEARVVRALADGVVRGEFGLWDEFVVPVMAGDGGLPTLLTEAFHAVGRPGACVTTSEAPYVTLPATWEKYLEALPSRKRRVIVHSLRDFDAWAGGAATLHRVRSADDLDEGKRVLELLHAERWRDAGQQGVFAAPRFQAFHDAVLPAWLADGALELTWLCVRGEPVAACYNVHWNNKVYFYQSGRKIDVPAKVRPGVVLMCKVMQAAIAAGRREFDFLGGASQYKLMFAATTRPLVEFRAARPSLVEWARHCAGRSLGVARRARNGLRFFQKVCTSVLSKRP